MSFRCFVFGVGIGAGICPGPLNETPWTWRGGREVERTETELGEASSGAAFRRPSDPDPDGAGGVLDLGARVSNGWRSP